jgi:hypothetical protein
MIKMFVNAKHKMNPKHEFALICLTDGAIWYQDFTNDVDLFVKRVSNLAAQGDFPFFNMSSLFDLFLRKTTIPQISVEDLKRFGTDYLYRMIFIYSRTTVVPEWSEGKEAMERLTASPIFFFDAMYLHKKPSKESNPQAVYDFITNVDSHEGNSFFSETHQSLRRVYLNFTLLLANPLQRPEQDKFKPAFSKGKE